MRVRVLGPVDAEVGGRALDLGTPKRRAVLAGLVLHRGRVVPTEVLARLVWGERPPPAATSTIQGHVAVLRRVLEPGRAAREESQVLLTRGAGYLLDGVGTDLDDLAAAVAQAREALGAAADDALAPGPEPRVAAQVAIRCADAVALWRGTPYAELADADDAVAERSRCAALAASARELHAVALLASGDGAGAAAELEALTLREPLHERLWAVRAVALARSGRQAEALDALRHVRRLLADELGLDPGDELRRVETAVLRQDVLVPAPPSTSPVAAHAPAAVPLDGFPPAATPAPPPALPAPPWPLVGRQDALGALMAALDSAVSGRPTAAAVVGEPGIGKSRLCAELATRATERGARVLVARCSQDDGAPPLRPWTSLLAALGVPRPPDAAASGSPATAADGRRLPEPAGTAAAEGFQARDAIARAVLDAAGRQPLVVVLDDLHRADVSTLRVLRHLLGLADDSTAASRLLLVTTWRPLPEPVGAHAEVVEALARRHAVRLDLTGLDSQDTARLVETVLGRTPGFGTVGTLWRRTDGNPFFVVEYARLLDQGGTTADSAPPSVGDVLRARLDVLPASTRTLLPVAAVLGRSFDLATLVRLTGTGEDSVLDTLDPAVAAGLVVEDGVGAFRFSHALVRDAAAATLGATRRARLHARAAEAVDALSGPGSDAARHWLAAGPAHVARAWRSALAAAQDADRLHAHDEARDLLRRAATAQALDPDVAWRERYELLMALVDACRALADWDGLTQAAEEAGAVAEAGGDADRAAVAAMQPGLGAPWHPRRYGEVRRPTVDALRRSLRRVSARAGTTSAPLRVQLLCALAPELYYDPSATAEIDDLVGQALDAADAVGDPRLQVLARHAAYVARQRPSTVADRLALAQDGLVTARQTGDERASALMAALVAVAHAEAGQVERFWPALDDARGLATVAHDAYLDLLLATTEAPWHALSGRSGEADVLVERARLLVERSGLPHGEDALIGVWAVRQWIEPDRAALLAGLSRLETGTTLPMSGVAAMLLLRAGEPDLARGLLRTRPVDVRRDDWFSLLVWSSACEVAAGLGLPDLGAQAYTRLAPFAGRTACAGSGGALGPVDQFLALGALAVGERGLASHHADDALALCDRWGLEPVARLVRDRRDRDGF